MIIFTKIRFKNFLSYGNNFTEIELDTHRTTLFYGKNGHGKSCFIDAITFGLYGKPFRKIVKNGLLNSINKKDLVVEIYFEVGSKKYKIIRGIKPNVFEIYCNDILVQQDAKVKDYQEQLERYILKMNYKTFTQVVILGSARYVPFMQLSTSDRRVVLEDLLDITIFSSMNVVLKEKQNTIKELIQVCKNDIELLKNKIDLHKQKLEESKKNSDEMISAKVVQINEWKVVIEATKEQIDKLEKLNVELIEKIKNRAQHELKLKKLYTIEGKIIDNEKRLKSEIEFFNENDSCSVCKQHIDQEFKTNIIKTTSTKLDEILDGKKKLKEEVDNLQEIMYNIQNIANEISANTSEIKRLNDEIAFHENVINLYQKEISDLSNKQDSSKSEEYSILSTLNDSLTDKHSLYENLITDKKYHDFISLLLKEGGIKSKIIKQYLPVLNKYINEYLKHLDFFVNYNIDENFEEIIKSRYRDEFKYANFSEGEKTRLDLAILFSFRELARIKNSVNTNLLILDEIFDSSLDSAGTDTFTTLMNTLTGKINIIVISHKNDQIAEKFDQVIKFEKVKNFSRMKISQ